MTLPTANLASATRVQNLWLWERYYFNKERLALKNRGKVNEIDTYHGTRGADPFVISCSDEGIDIRYSHKGSWGIANYFTGYADMYANITTDNERQTYYGKSHYR